jgi:hypothetical protein
MIEDLGRMIKETQELAKQAHILDIASRDQGTVLVKPRVWDGPEKAKAAAKDWRVREEEELRLARREIEKKLES